MLAIDNVELKFAVYGDLVVSFSKYFAGLHRFLHKCNSMNLLSTRDADINVTTLARITPNQNGDQEF